ncbi:MAG: UDP-N-acetylglucosamine-N-acetylmuramyl-(pentapeptide) pyrophosphoryl-undecaprenol N-acetylglucosamine transferase [Bacteroidetes bacterium]|nr:MAG: UDP-N-acetylglucosamine-N-acetylmuramyl-(pentapeptide) pyrophosphoryl-undecaprenol N-acetylglucosamine transferase [Bacteroidota bacterium]
MSGGGTGGHIFPAIAIANALKTKAPDAEFLFVGAEGRMEMEKVPAAGYKIEGLNISGIQRKLTFSNFAVPFKLIGSLLKAKRILKQFKPDAVIGTGGYASGPMLRVASKAGVVTLIQEQNSYPGITNKILAKRVDRICVAYNNMDRFFPKEKIIFTGNPVRQDIQNMEGKKPRGLEHFGIAADKPVLLVIGGSLGARTINESIAAGLEQLSKTGIQLVWQTGKSFFPQAQEAVKKYESMKAFDFIQRMDLAYAVADFVVSRAGASSISELCIVHKPSIFVPSPNVAEDHQTKNAMALVTHKAAVLVKDSEAKEKLLSEVLVLAGDADLRHKMELGMAGLAVPNSAEIIAGEVLSMVNKKREKKK